MAQQFCRRCLLGELADDRLHQTVADYIDSIPAERKVPAIEYAKRIAVCKGCDHLVNGMCSLCGCYVETRAIKKEMHCAKSKEFW